MNHDVISQQFRRLDDSPLKNQTIREIEKKLREKKHPIRKLFGRDRIDSIRENERIQNWIDRNISLFTKNDVAAFKKQILKERGIESESKTTNKTYTIFYQYPRYKVILSGQKCRIISMREKKEKIIPFTKAWIGKNDDYEERAVHDQKKFIGNTILLEDKSTCYWLGDDVYTFKLKPGEHITEYHSPMGNNDVPYPFARTSLDRWLLLIENIAFKAVPSEYRSPYAVYYDSIPQRTFWDNLLKRPHKPSSLPIHQLKMKFVF